MEISFNYIKFANDMKIQARRLVPYELHSNRDFVANRVEEYIIKLAKGFEAENFSSDLDDEKYAYACQVIAEWTFHKSVDLLNSHIPPEYYDEILDNIGYVIYELLKQYVDDEISQDDILEVVEAQVKFEYKRVIEDYERRGIIDEVEKNYALSQSHIDKLAENQNKKHNSNFYSLDKNESRYLNDKVLVSYAGNLIYKYMLKAAKILKQSNCNAYNRRVVVGALRNSLEAFLSKIEGFEEFELNIMQVERLVTVASEIIFHRVVVLHKLNLLETFEAAHALDYLAIIIFDLEIAYIKDNNKLKDTFEYTKGFSNNNFKKYFKDYVDDGTITREQYNGLLGKTYIEYLMPTINNLMYPNKSDKLKDVISWSLFAIFWIFYILYKVFLHSN